MKLKKIFFYCFLALPASVISAFLTLRFTVSPETGFYLPDKTVPGIILSVLVFLFPLIAAFFAMFTYKQPAAAPKVNLPISVISFLSAAAFLYLGLTCSFSTSVFVWQIVLFKLAGIAAAFYFVYYGIMGLLGKSSSPALANIPAISLLVVIICTFSSVSSVASIFENIILVLPLCSILVFFLAFSRVYNNEEDDLTPRKLLTSSVLASTLCLASSVSQFLIPAAVPTFRLRSDFSYLLLMFTLGIFAAVFTVYYILSPEKE